MSRVRDATMLVAAVAVLGTGCSGIPRPAATADPPGASPPGSAPAEDRERLPCEEHSPRPPSGFDLAGSRDVVERDHVGVHLRYRAPGRRVHYLIGITGEIGEGLPFHGELRLGGGRRVRLLGEAKTWAAVWDLPRPCAQAAVVGSGMPKKDFLRLVRRVTAADS